MQNRRGFFKSIAGLFAVAAVAPDTLLRPAPGLAFAKDAFDVAARDLPLNDQFKRLTAYMHKELVGQIGTFPELGPESKISHDFQHLYGIDMCLDEKQALTLADDDIHSRFVLPAMTALANEIKERRATHFARLPMPGTMDRSCRVDGHGVSLRGLGMYDIVGNEFRDPGWIHRFDVLFAGRA